MTLVVFLIGISALFYYKTQEKLQLAEQRATLTKYAYIQTKRLKVLHHYFGERYTYPRDSRFNSAIYDIDFRKIFSLLDDEEINFKKEIYFSDKGYIHFIKSLDEYYLGTKYLVLEMKDDGLWRHEIWKSIAGYGLLSFILFLLFGLYLAKLFLKPMRDSIMLLDRFIKDTTHELNTPLSAILANIEMMDKEVMIEKNIVKLNRINIAAKTVSVLYKDLTYLTLEQEQEESNELIEIKSLIYNRAEYFNILAQSKKLECDLDLEEATIYADKRKFTRVIDNLISNAIKYNKRNGTVGITLRQGKLIIWDTGIGIGEDKIPFMFDRYLRFDDSAGGFGVGLSIVKTILDEYNISIDVKSIENEGTRMEIKWQK